MVAKLEISNKDILKKYSEAKREYKKLLEMYNKKSKIKSITYFNFKAKWVEDKIKDIIDRIDKKYEITEKIYNKVLEYYSEISAKKNNKKILREKIKIIIENAIKEFLNEKIIEIIDSEISEFLKREKRIVKDYNDNYVLERVYIFAYKYLSEKIIKKLRFISSKNKNVIRGTIFNLLVENSNLFKKVYSKIFLIIYQNLFDYIKEKKAINIALNATNKSLNVNEEIIVNEALNKFFSNLLFAIDIIYVQNFVTFVRMGFKQTYIYSVIVMSKKTKARKAADYEKITSKLEENFLEDLNTIHPSTEIDFTTDLFEGDFEYIYTPPKTRKIFNTLLRVQS